MNSKSLSQQQFESLSNLLKEELSSLGLEHYPFKIEWYNKVVDPKFRLKFDDNCIAFVIISTPDMFENAFIPYLQKHWSDFDSKTDPIDDCMKYQLNGLKSKLSHLSMEVIHDFEILPSKKPRVLVQTAAHVSGAAYYYKSDLIDCKQLGVCIHPVFGGWFAIRAVVIFTHLTTNAIKQRQPKDVISTKEQKQHLLEKFNLYWMDGEYRDVIPVTKKYSDLQKKYFSTQPSQRKALIKELIDLKN